MLGVPVSDVAVERRSAQRVRSQTVLFVLVTGYFALMAGLAFAGHFTFVFKTALVPIVAVFAALTGQGRRFARDWAPFLGVVLLFDSGRGIVYAIVTRWELPVYAGFPIAIDRSLLGGVTLPNLLQASWYDPRAVRLVDAAAMIVHASFFVCFIVFGLIVWTLRRDRFERYTVALAVLFAAGVAVFLVLPTMPPWMAFEQFHLIPPIHRLISGMYDTISPHLDRTFDVNPIAAFPSLHAGVPALCAFVAMHEFGKRGALVMVPFTVAMWLAVGYLGEHYLADVLAGAGLAAAAYVLVYRIDVKRARGALAVGGNRAKVIRAVVANPILCGVLLAVTAEGIGEASIALRRDYLPSDAFIESELRGRSDLADLWAARRALTRGDVSQALATADATLRDGVLQSTRDAALRLIAEIAVETRDVDVIRAHVAPLDAERRGLLGDLMLASSELLRGQQDAGNSRLVKARDSHPRTAAPVYLSTVEALASGRVTLEQARGIAIVLENPNGSFVDGRRFAAHLREAIAVPRAAASDRLWEALRVLTR